MIGYYDWDGNPIDLMTWARTLESEGNSIARHDGGTWRVSTVWLGLDHNWGDGPPLIFETMVFGDHKLVDLCLRYSTKEEALAGHAETVEQCSLMEYYETSMADDD